MAANHRREGASRLYVHRPLLSKSIDDFRYVQDAIHRASGRSPAFDRRVLRSAGVSLLTSAQICYALDNSKILQQMEEEAVRAALAGSLPESNPDGIPLEVTEVAALGAMRTHLVAYVEHPDLVADYRALTEAVYRLGGVALLEHEEPPHISFGTYSKQVPNAVMAALDQNQPLTYMVGPPQVGWSDRAAAAA